jgi:hypothetical protein
LVEVSMVVEASMAAAAVAVEGNSV